LSTPRERPAAAIEARETTTRDRMRLVAILEATSDLVCVITPDHRLRYLNAAGRQLLGIAPDEPLDRFDSRQFLPERERLPQSAGPAQGSGQDVIQLERELHRVDGSSVLVSQVLLMHRSLDGRSEYISTIARDISEQRRQEHALRQAQRWRPWQLAGGVAHDFNNWYGIVNAASRSSSRCRPVTSGTRRRSTSCRRRSARHA
jgi:PAS domain S-box-containing protein